MDTKTLHRLKPRPKMVTTTTFPYGTAVPTSQTYFNWYWDKVDAIKEAFGTNEVTAEALFLRKNLPAEYADHEAYLGAVLWLQEREAKALATGPGKWIPDPEPYLALYVSQYSEAVRGWDNTNNDHLYKIAAVLDYFPIKRSTRS